MGGELDYPRDGSEGSDKCGGNPKDSRIPASVLRGPPYFGKTEYPRGFCGGNTRKVHFLSPHFEHRIRLATSSNRASQPHKVDSVRGSAVRSCPHAPHLKDKVSTKLIAQLFDMKLAPHLTNCCESPSGRPSSIGAMTILYGERIWADLTYRTCKNSVVSGRHHSRSCTRVTKYEDNGRILHRLPRQPT